MQRLLITLLLFALASVASASDLLGQARAMYARGEFEQAAALARTLPGADARALAAQATLVMAVYLAPPNQKLGLFRLAVADARDALAMDSQQVDAHLQLALALGHIAELESPVGAYLAGYASEAKAHADLALALDPDNAWPHAVLGIWHLEVVRHAGAELARDLYSASKEAGLEHCAAAERLAPGQIVLRFGCTVARLLLDPATYEQEAIRELTLVSGLPAHDAAEHLVEERARDLLEQLGGDATDWQLPR